MTANQSTSANRRHAGRSGRPPRNLPEFGSIWRRLLQSPSGSGAGRWSFGGSGVATWRFLLDVYNSMTTFFRSQQD